LRLWFRFCRDVARVLIGLLWGLRVTGREKIPRKGPVVLACNHISLLDPAVVGSVVPREAGFVAKKELFAVFLLGPLIRSLNSIPIDRARLSMETMDVLADFLASDKALVFFPEGTRSRDGRLGKPKVGIGVLLGRCPAMIVPAYVEGTNDLVRNLFRRGRVRITFGDPFALPSEAESPSDDRARARFIAETVFERIRRLSEEVRSN
jgi:1-acyl-sn-glycerol-3-phosphate acyltransferase